MKRRGLGLGARLLLFSSVLLALPWLGYRYIGEMKEFLIKGQEEAQLLAVRAVATVLHDRSDLFGLTSEAADIPQEQNSLYVYPLEGVMQMDGYADDWASLLERKRIFTAEGTAAATDEVPHMVPSFALVLGGRPDYVHGFLQVEDEVRVYRHPRYRRLDNSDQVRLALIDPQGRLRRFVLVTEAQGNISGYEVQADWGDPLTAQPLYELNGFWRERPGGYDLEFRFPAEWLGKTQRLSLAVVDVDDPLGRSIEAVVTTTPGQWSGAMNRLIVRSPELMRILRGLSRSDASICVVDGYRRVRAVMGGESIGKRLCAGTDRVSQDLVQDALAGRPKVLRRNGVSDQEALIVAAHPVYSGDQVIGAVLLEKNSAHILGLQRATLVQTAGATLLVLLLVVAGLLLFAAWLAFRIRHLKREVAAAIDADGRVLKGRLESDRLAPDDLGDLSRGISDLLGRLQRYTGFLESVPRTLRHEILNPLNTIGMSLQKLEEVKEADDGVSIKSAQQAMRQLERIVNSLTEAAHIDDALDDEVFESFDLAALLDEYVGNRSRLRADRRLIYHGPANGIWIRGSDLRIAQLLDKIVDNALDFSCENSEIEFTLEERQGWAELRLSNEGPVIPERILQALFVGMASYRPQTDRGPHLGIGLFIAKRIASCHGGELKVVNRQDIAGVEVILRLPTSIQP